MGTPARAALRGPTEGRTVRGGARDRAGVSGDWPAASRDAILGRMTMIGDGAAAPTIRAARPEDAPGIAKALLEAPQFDGTLSEKGLSNLVERAIAAIGGDQETMLVAELDGAAAGYTHVHWVSALFLPGPEGYVTELFVQRGARGRGCGTALLQAVEAIGVERRAARLFLLNGRQSEAYSGGYYRGAGSSRRFILQLFAASSAPDPPPGPTRGLPKTLPLTSTTGLLTVHPWTVQPP